MYDAKKIEIDGEVYVLLKEEAQYMLLEKEGGISEYILLTGIDNVNNQLFWKRAQYFSNRPAAEQVAKKIDSSKKQRENLRREMKIAKRLAAQTPIDLLVRQEGKMAVTETIAAIINGKQRLPVHIKSWALTVTGKTLNTKGLKNSEIIDIWRGARKQRLFFYQEGDEK